MLRVVRWIRGALGWERPQLPMIGATQPQSRPSLSQAHRNADTIAIRFVSWLRYFDETGLWTSQDMVGLCSFFLDQTGIRQPPAHRTILAALKREGRVVFRPNVRVYGLEGEYLRKTTLYSLSAIPGSVAVQALSLWRADIVANG